MFEVAIAELLDVESVFDPDEDFAILGGKQGSILKPGGKVDLGNLLFNLC